MEYYKVNTGNPTLNYSDIQKWNLDEDKNSDLLKTIMVSVDINFYL